MYLIKNSQLQTICKRCTELQDRFEIGIHMWPDLLAFCPVEVLTNSLFSIKFEDGLRVILEYFKSVSDGLWFVVIPALDLGRVEHEVVDPAAGGVDPPVLHSLNDGFERDTKVNNDIDRCLLLQCFGLPM